jgi:predicted nucleotidyltransferase
VAERPVLTPDYARALVEVGSLWASGEAVLIGASALLLRLDTEWRTTRDLDLVVVSSVEGLDDAFARLSGWSRDPRRENRLTNATRVGVDVLPAGPKQLEAGSIEWRDGRRMSTVGLRHVFEHSDRLEIAKGYSWPVARVSVLTLLKAAAYRDRPNERERDLEDLAQILEYYPSFTDPGRFEPDPRAEGLSFEARGPYLLGRELGAFVDERERRILDDLIGRLLRETDRGVAQGVMLREAPAGWGRDPRALIERVRGLEIGLESR